MASVVLERGEREELAVQRPRVLRELRLSRVAGGDIEAAVRAEPDPPGVVDGAGNDPVDERSVGNQTRAGPAPALEPHARRRSEVEVGQPVPREAGIEHEAQQAALAL